MKISTKVECGIIALIDIAIHSENGEAVVVHARVTVAFEGYPARDIIGKGIH